MKVIQISLDFETRSPVDLTTAGAHLYASHPQAEVMCMAYSIGAGPERLWKFGDEPPVELLMEITSGAVIVAWNAAFERLIWRYICVLKYGWPPIPDEQLYCSMAMAFFMGLPGALENCALFLGMAEKKDSEGHRIMLQLSTPRKVIPGGCEACGGSGADNPAEPCGWCLGNGEGYEWWEPTTVAKDIDVKAKFARLYLYCIQDVVVERAITKHLLPLSHAEREIWLLDQKINDRGLAVDIPLVHKALRLVELEKASLTKRVQDLTEGEVSTPNARNALVSWLSDFGLPVPSLAKADVSVMLSYPGLPDICRDVLLIRQMAAKSSTSKFKAMIASTGPDGRARGLFQYSGAAATHRWAGRRFQPQNMPRPMLDQWQIDAVFELLEQLT